MCTHSFGQIENYCQRMNCPGEMICTICSDRAEGYHFGAISCAACGAFFRRSISDQKVYSCLSRNCIILFDPTKRGGCCRFCRFLKCLISGMLPHEVRAKRFQNTLNSPSLFRALSAENIGLLDQLVTLRRTFQAERRSNTMETTPTSTSPSSPIAYPLISSISQEFELFKLAYTHHQFLSDIIGGEPLATNDWRNGLSMGGTCLFMAFYVFEMCHVTADHGGVQLDRLVLPNRTFVELSEHGIRHFLQIDNLELSRVCYASFSLLVQQTARNLQSVHLDETFQAVLLYTLLTQSALPYHRRDDVEARRDALLFQLSHLEPPVLTVSHDFWVLVQQIQHGVHVFRDFLHHIFL